MLVKLMKYEFKATARMFLPMYLIILALALINRLFMELNGYSTSFRIFPENDMIQSILSILTGATMTIYILGLIAMFFISFIIFVYRFYKNLMCDEGYLMMTLPVKPSQHIWAKLHTSMIWSVATILVFILSLFILLLNGDGIQWMVQNIPFLFHNLIKGFFETELITQFHLVFFIIEFIVLLVVSNYSGIVFYYACLALGHRLSKKHKILYAIGAYLVISFVMQIVALILMMFAGIFLESIVLSPTALGHLIMIGSIILSAAEFVLFFFITHSTLSKHLNLE